MASAKHWICFSILLLFASSFSTRFNLPTANWKVHNHLNFNDSLVQNQVLQIAEKAISLVAAKDICSTVQSALAKAFPAYYWGVTFIPEGQYGSNTLFGTHFIRLLHDRSPLGLFISAIERSYLTFKTQQTAVKR